MPSSPPHDGNAKHGPRNRGRYNQAFQAKCFERILEFKRAGRTIFCVSHNLDTLESLCQRAIWLDHGEVMMDGTMRTVREAYEGRLNFKTEICEFSASVHDFT